MNVMISGVWASNKGDRAIASYLVTKLLQNSNVDKIYISTNEPNLLKKFMPSKVIIVKMGYLSHNKITRAFSKLIGFPILKKCVINDYRINFKFIANSSYINALKEIDFIILTGGHHITTMREKDSIYAMTYELGLINRSKKKYILWSQTIGPLDFKKKINQMYILKLLEEAEKIYIRDNNSKELLKEIFPNLINIDYSYDSVFGIKTLMKESLNQSKSPKLNVVGISIFYSNFKTEIEVKKYIYQMKEICKNIISKGFNIKFFPMETSEQEIQIIKEIIALSETASSIEIVNTNVTTIEQLKEMEKCRFYIGHKTHSVIISLMLGIPLIALCYHEKTYDFMKLFNVEEYGILDKDYNQEWFIEKFNQLINYEDEISKKLEEKGSEVSKKVNIDFDKILII